MPFDYKIPQLDNLYAKLHAKKFPVHVAFYRAAFLENLRNYWEYALASYSMYLEWRKNIEQILGTDKKVDHEMTAKCHSLAIGTYNNMRICLTACNRLADNAQRTTVSDEYAYKLFEYRKAHRKGASSIIDFRNRVGAHPDEESEMVIKGLIEGYPSKIIFGPIDVNALKVLKLKEVDIEADFKWLHDYIVGLMEHLDRCWLS